MDNPVPYMFAGAAAYAALTWIYRRFFDATTGHVDVLGKENKAISAVNQSLRAEIEQLRSIAAANGLEVPQSDHEARIRELLASGQKIQAVKYYREFAGVGLLEAKNAVEAVERRRPVPSNANPTPDTGNRIGGLIIAGNKIAAIRDYRAQTGASLADAKAHIENLARQLGK